jgi:hypothetical protein
MFNPDRDQARQFFFDTWAKYRASQPLTALESQTLDILLAHPEYQPLLDTPQRHAQRDWLPETGETNPFLHLALHLALAEQLSIDQPHGLKTRYLALHEKLGDEMAAQHACLECLGETLWQSQRYGTPLDAAIYLGCLDRLLGRQ